MAKTQISRKIIPVLLFIVVFFMVLVWWTSLSSGPVTVTIPENSSARQISSILYDAGAISSRTAFMAAVRITGKAKHLKAGTYLIPARTSVFGIAGMISCGRGVYERVTIPEGFTAAEIAETLAARGVTDKEIFKKAVEERKLEGYLFPETYYFSRNTPCQEVIDKMLKEFEANFTPEMQKRADELKMGKKKIVTLASIIEKEAVVARERPLIAGVFYNRLKKRWFLESCATVQYALGARKSVLTYKDVRIDSPYNTYKFYGLPPGPVCSPGKDSINAALYPETTEDMFFVAAGSGTHVFSRYFREHINSKLINKKRRGTATAK